MHRYTHVAASLIVLAAVATLLFPPGGTSTVAAAEDGIIFVPEGGRLDALNERGELLGPCPLKHTDVDVQVSGHFTRVSVTQRYHNPHDEKIEAVYTFPLSHRAAVDRMTMTVGSRVVQGEVKRREVARQIYESARQAGHVASLLEQERPNIFTQSVANIEPGAEVVIEISYVEVLQSVDGEYRFEFPTVVAPRYTPGRPTGVNLPDLPPGVEPRPGLVLLGPAAITCEDGNCEGLTSDWLRRHTVAIAGSSSVIDPERRSRQDPQRAFRVAYADDQIERGVLFDDGIGHIGGRWFFCPPRVLPAPGEPFSLPTDEVPDADRVTPMPVKPDQRAGHDISIRVTIDTGGPEIVDVTSHAHEITGEASLNRPDAAPQKATIALAGNRAIPNRDFRLSWRLTSEKIEEAFLTHTGRYSDDLHGFFTLILQPPDRIADEDVRPRELLFVLDNSGSMRGRQAILDEVGTSALDAAKDVITQAIDTMRPNDRFNVISFNHTLDALWDEPQPNSPENRARARRYVDQRQGGGGTEMRNAVLKAIGAEPFARKELAPRPSAHSPMELANLPADGREVAVTAPMTAVAVRDGRRYVLRASRDVEIDLDLRVELPTVLQPEGVNLLFAGRWVTERGRRAFIVDEVQMLDADEEIAGPMRIVLFVTDGLVSNDAAIIEAIREHAHETRVFTIGMSQAPNRHLLDEMARAGRGAVDYVLPGQDVAPIVQRFADRIATPVLTDIELDFSEHLTVMEILPSAEHMPDLFDVQPLVIHGRYAEPGAGTLTIRGRTGVGRFERVLELELPDVQPRHDTIATLWAREKVGELMREAPGRGVREIVDLGERFQIVTQYTSFVAVEKQRVTIGGEPRLVRVPIEFPKDMSWDGIFGRAIPELDVISRVPEDDGAAALQRVRQLQMNREHHRALGILDALLAVEPENVGAVALRDVIEEVDEHRMQASARRNAHSSYGRDASASREESARRLVQYPEDWPATVMARGREGAAAEHRAVPDAAPSPPRQAPPPPEMGIPGRDGFAEHSGEGGRGMAGGGGFGGGGGGGGAGGGLPFGTPVEGQGRVIAAQRLRPGQPPVARGQTPATPLPGDIPLVGSDWNDRHDASERAVERPIRALTLPHADAETLARDLNVALGLDESGELVDGIIPLGRAEAVPEQDIVFLIVAADLYEIILPFSERFAASDLTDDAGRAVIDELVAALKESAPDMRRERELQRRLDAELYSVIRDSDADLRNADDVLALVLVVDLYPATLDALRERGLSIDDTVEDRRLIAGRVAPADLETLALHEAVQRIEPLDEIVRE